MGCGGQVVRPDHQNVHFLYGKMICATQYTDLDRCHSGGEGSDTMDMKLTILFLLIGAILAVSSLGDGALDRVRQQIRGARQR